jgi:hypothetical protein
MPKRSSILIWTVWAAVFVLSICKAPARDLGQWEGADPEQRKWFRGLMQPDRPNRSCCGLADAYWADSYEVKDNQYIAIITDERDDEPLNRPHIENGRRFVVPNSKIKWDSGNPTGTALSLSALVLRSIVTCHRGEDRFSSLKRFGSPHSHRLRVGQGP